MKIKDFAKGQSQYLEKRGAARPALLWNRDGAVDTIVVVPLIAERQNIPELLDSLERQDAGRLLKTLFLFVVNNSVASPAEIKAENAETIEYLRAYFKKSVALRGGIIDCSSAGLELPVKDAGVGLARKTGLDTALELFSSPAGKNILVCLDGDCTVAPNYLAEIHRHFEQTGGDVAAVQYEHRTSGDSAQNDAINRYEVFLRYYILGLRLAGSPYAHHSIGSTMAFSSRAYIACEGMNKYKAGEDFYFLEKARKQFSVILVNTTRVFPSPRPSWRVPFGTGRGVTKILAGDEMGKTLYNPDSFGVLARWLRLLSAEAGSSPELIVQRAKQIHPALAAFLVERNFKRAWAKIQRNHPSPGEKQQITWFDGFSTLKFIHHLRDGGFPNMPMEDAVRRLLECVPGYTGRTPKTVAECLSALRLIATRAVTSRDWL